MNWYFPAWNGDHRLVPDPENPAGCKLVVEKPSPEEQSLLVKFAQVALRKGWFQRGALAHTTIDDLFSDDRTIRLNAPIAKAGKALLKIIRPGAATLTAVKYSDGTVAVAESAERVLDEVLEPSKAIVASASAVTRAPTAAASVSRPTICCPRCIPGAVERASEVLLSFLTPEQHEMWAAHRMIAVVGHLSGHRYLLSHRNTSRAVKHGFICYDLDSRNTLHFHDWSVPPEEEVLAAKLILEHREPWLRNEASLYHDTRWSAEPIFKNPFGNWSDGVPDAAFVHALGNTVRAFESVAGGIRAFLPSEAP